MKISKKILPVIGFLLLGSALVYGAGQIIVLDPLSSFEVRVGEVAAIPVGANFLIPGNYYWNAHELSVVGMPHSYSNLTIQENTPYRTAGVLTVAPPEEGTYYLTVVALDKVSGARTEGTIRINATYDDYINKPILFDSLEQIKEIKPGTWYSFAIAAKDEEPEPLDMNVIGTGWNGLGWVGFRNKRKGPGKVGGSLIMYMFREGEFKINASARDERDGGDINNDASADIHFIVTDGGGSSGASAGGGSF